MFRKKSNKPQSRIDSLIGVGTTIEGNVSFVGGLRVDGEIHVSHLVVNGAINGPVFSAEFLELQARSRVKGDVHYNTLEMHLGAVVEGRLVHSAGVAGGKTVELKIASRS